VKAVTVFSITTVPSAGDLGHRAPVGCGRLFPDPSGRDKTAAGVSLEGHWRCRRR
jgi:hypothetical protein